MYFDLIDDVKAGSWTLGAGLGQVTGCDLCDFCFEGHDRFAHLDPACPNDRARVTVRRISDRCLSVFWTSLPRRDLSPRIKPHHRFANRHLKPNAPARLCPFRPFSPTHHACPFRYSHALLRSRHHRHTIRQIIATRHDTDKNAHNDACRNNFIINAT
jgi:hypothetical protein